MEIGTYKPGTVYIESTKGKIEYANQTSNEIR